MPLLRTARVTGDSKVFRRGIALFLLASAITAVPAQSTGDAAIAERYVEWAIQAIGEDRWAEAGEALERAREFAEDSFQKINAPVVLVSSDLYYLLALTRRHENRPQGTILEAVRQSLTANQWNRFSAETARLLEAETLIHIRKFDEALRSLALVPASGAEAILRLRALLGLGQIGEFRRTMAQALELYSRETEPVRILFRYAADRLPEPGDRELIDLCLRRLPLLTEVDPDLAYLAVPFIRDTDEARRLVASYRAMGGNAPEAIPAALNLGVIEDFMAASELFKQNTLDRDLIRSVWNLLRSTEGREQFSRNLLRFTGVIGEDRDKDGITEGRTRYRDGVIQEHTYDADQDGYNEWRISCNAGIPALGECRVELSSGENGPEHPARLLSEATALIVWEQYPAVGRAVFDVVTYWYRPREFLVTPLQFSELAGTSGEVSFGGLSYPERNVAGARLTKRTLGSFAAAIERPSGEFAGAIERVELVRGIPVGAVETRNGRTISTTEFVNGRPVVQRVDLDLDGRMETVRRFRRASGGGVTGDEAPWEYTASLESAESDWDGDGIYETGEEYLPDGTVARSWDMDRDGVKEFTVIHPGN